MLIGELAQRAGTTSRTLRYYETHGLLQAGRSANGYRTYDESELRVVREIRSLLAIGFGLTDIRPFVDCLREGHATGDACPDSVAALRRKLAEVDACMAELAEVRQQLQAQVAQATSGRQDQGAQATAGRWEDPCTR
jgi:DNA-binding transcriptional MerR regulator